MYEWRETAAGLSTICASVFLPKASVARNWLIRNLRRIQFVIQEDQLYAECGARLKNFCLSNLLCICPSVFETYLNKAREGRKQSKFDK